jgi:hypothetical protein
MSALLHSLGWGDIPETQVDNIGQIALATAFESLTNGRARVEPVEKENVRLF